MKQTNENQTFFRWAQLKGGEEAWHLILADQTDKYLREKSPAFTTILAADNDFKSSDMTAEDMAKVHYLGDWYLDFDASSIEEAITQYQKFLTKLRDEYDFDLHQASLYASGGKGFHIIVPMQCLVPKVKPQGVMGLPAIFKEMASETYVDCLDMRVYTARRGRQFRTVNVERPDKPGVYKVPLTVEESFDMTPEKYRALCSAPRYVPAPAPAEFNPNLGLLYATSYSKVEKALKTRKKSKADAKLLQKFGGDVPPSIRSVMSGECKLGVGFQKIATQLALTAHALAKTEEQFLALCAGLIDNHVSDGNRYNTPEKRRRELSRMYQYMAENPCYTFSIGGVKSLMPEGTSTPDLDEGAAAIVADTAVEDFNQDHAVVITGGTTCIMREGQSESGGRAISFMNKEALATYYANQAVFVEHVGARGETSMKRVPLVSHWLSHPGRRTHEGVTLAPTRAVPEGFFNLWRGFEVEPLAASAFKCRRFVTHLKMNVCRGYKEHFRYLLAWLADTVQRPEAKPGVALVLRGLKGTGKSKVADVLRAIYGAHAFKANRSDQIVGRFNAHLADKVLLVAEETFFAGDHAAVNTLKDLVTSTSLTVEPKHIGAFEVRSCHRVVMITNADWAVHATEDERRYFVLDVGDERAQDHEFFAAIDSEMFGEDGRSPGVGCQAFLGLLQAYNLQGVNLRKVPQTEALKAQKRLSLSVEDQFIADCLEDESVAGESWPEEVGADGWWLVRAEVYRWYVEYAKNRKSRPKHQAQFWPHFEKRLGSRRDRQGATQAKGSARPIMEVLPSLEVARSRFKAETRT